MKSKKTKRELVNVADAATEMFIKDIMQGADQKGHRQISCLHCDGRGSQYNKQTKINEPCPCCDGSGIFATLSLKSLGI